MNFYAKSRIAPAFCTDCIHRDLTSFRLLNNLTVFIYFKRTGFGFFFNVDQIV